MSEILVGAAAAAYLKANPSMTQHAQPTCKGVKVTVNPRKQTTTMLELVILRNLIDSLIADKLPEEVEMNLYSARLHVVRAIREVAK